MISFAIFPYGGFGIFLKSSPGTFDNLPTYLPMPFLVFTGATPIHLDSTMLCITTSRSSLAG